MITLKTKYGNKLRILITGTYEINTEDVYEDFRSDKKLFDFSNYSNKSKYYNDSNTIVIGKMNDYTSGVAIENLLDWSQKCFRFS